MHTRMCMCACMHDEMSVCFKIVNFSALRDNDFYSALSSVDPSISPPLRVESHQVEVSCVIYI